MTRTFTPTFATNWLQHGVYGQTQGGQPEKQIVPTDTRLPGYPAFLAGIFWLFGAGNFKAVMLTQILVDLGHLPDRRRPCPPGGFRTRGENRFCPGGAVSVSRELCRRGAHRNFGDLLYGARSRLRGRRAESNACGRAEVRADVRAERGALDQTHRQLWAATGAAIAACILLRPDGGICWRRSLFI